MMETGEWRGEKADRERGTSDTRVLLLPIGVLKQILALLSVTGVVLAFGGRIYAANAKLDAKADFSYVRTVDDSLGRLIAYHAGQLDQIRALRDDMRDVRADLAAVLRNVCSQTSPEDRQKTGMGCR